VVPLADLIAKEIGRDEVKGELEDVEFHGGDQQG
jgi:hypothetical protein